MENLNKLKKQVEKQRNINASLKELREVQEEKNRLELEYKRLSSQNSKKTNWGKIGSDLKQLGGKILSGAEKAKRDLDTKKGLGLFR